MERHALPPSKFSEADPALPGQGVLEFLTPETLQSTLGLTETDIVKLTLGLLNASGLCRVWRQNTGAVSVPGQGGKKARYVKFGMKGAADVTGLLNDGRRLEVELKTRTGRVRPEQVQYAEMIRARGGIYILARSADEALSEVRKHGQKTAV